jgi:2-keto-4-pentenoate hydratase/2-oxohepta-3-ene-1,7-dioic acid hydratase in catechol pathway
MQIRRVLHESGSIAVETRTGDNDGWAPSDLMTALGFASPFTDDFEALTARLAGAKPGDVVLPFQPLSFRDFMLFEQHNIDAARGYTRRFRPRVSRLAAAFESLAGRPFPAYRPKPLWYQQPIYYMSNAMTMVPSGTPVAFPPYSHALDYELELGFVLKEPLLNASPAQAEAAIGAFVVLCDFSARDVQIPEMNSGFGPQKSKHFIGSLSSTAVTADEILDRWRELRATVTINGEAIAHPSPASPRFGLGDTIARASAGERLYPGELFATGTLVGGSGMEIGRWLSPGDQLSLEIAGVGRIDHRIL